jgi:hypothetical protein
MGTVYEADDAARGRVAVKVLPPVLAGDSAFVSRFRREATLLASLSHPHLVEVFDQGEEEGRFWFAMEYVPGESLRRRLERGLLPWRDAVRVAKEVLLGLGYAHGRGVAHRDLKPENVLLAEDGRARLVDFGLSRIVRGESAEDTARLTRTNVILGTYEYMAPEQRLGAPDVDERADFYALGVILYELLTGALPLGRFPAPSESRPGTPRSLDAIVHRALAPSPKDRFPSAAAFREALEDAERAAGDASLPVPVEAAPRAAAIPLPDRRMAEARSVLRHVEILASLDRALGVICLLLMAGLWGFRGRMFPFSSVSTVVLLVGGILLLKQGRRLADMVSGAREAQVTASVLLLFFVPFGTPVGVYGLIVMTSQRARDAFAIGRARLLAPPLPPPPPPPPPPAPVVHHAVHRPGRPPRDHARFLPRALLLVGLAFAVAAATPLLDRWEWTKFDQWVRVKDPGAGAALAGAALVLAALWARFPRNPLIRGLVTLAVAAALFLIAWQLFFGADAFDRGPPWHYAPPRRTG